MAVCTAALECSRYYTPRPYLRPSFKQFLPHLDSKPKALVFFLSGFSCENTCFYNQHYLFQCRRQVLPAVPYLVESVQVRSFHLPYFQALVWDCKLSLFCLHTHGLVTVVCPLQVEGTFRDGTKLVTVHDPFSSEDGDLALALHGSFLPGARFSYVIPQVAILCMLRRDFCT